MQLKMNKKGSNKLEKYNKLGKSKNLEQSYFSYLST